MNCKKKIHVTQQQLHNISYFELLDLINLQKHRIIDKYAT